MNFSPKLRTGLAWAWTVIILIGLSIPRFKLPDIAENEDKSIHTLIFALFGFLWVWAGRRAGWVLLAGFLYGGFTEVYQSLMPINRVGDWHDVRADAIGTALGVALGWVWLRYVEKRLVG